jgi:hypothetical protein
MVLCTSVSKTLKKQSLHICCPVFGRLNIAFAFWQRAQLFGAIACGDDGGECLGGLVAGRATLCLASLQRPAMPKELRKRGKRHKKSATEHQTLSQEQEIPPDEGPSGGPSWIVPRASSSQFNPEAPFGYVDPDLKAYFRTVDDQLKEWQQNNWDDGEGDEDMDPNESALLFSHLVNARVTCPCGA